MRNAIRIAAAVLAVLIAAMPLMAQGAQEGAASGKADKITIAYHPHITGLGAVLEAEQNGYFDEENLDVEFVQFTNGASELAAMASGDIDLGYLGVGAHVFAPQGRCVILSMDSTDLSAEVLVRADSGIKTFEDLKGKTVLISGSGNVAQYTAEKVLELGGKVLTMSDSNGYIYDPDGIDREKLDYIMELKNLYRGRIREYAEKYNVKYVEGARPWNEKADIALPSATQNEINGDDARALIANGVMAVSEGANMPSTPEAIRVFQEAKILYAPGKAANAGGVSVSGLEMTQNSMRLGWSAEEVDEKLHSIMKNIHENCVKYGTEPDGYVNYVKGANVAGFMKVAKAMMAQGIV